MLNCKQATELMSQEQERSLVFKERLGLRFHLAMCGGCRNFRKQVGFLHRACAHYSGAGAEEKTEGKAL